MISATTKIIKKQYANVHLIIKALKIIRVNMKIIRNYKQYGMKYKYINFLSVIKYNLEQIIKNLNLITLIQ